MKIRILLVTIIVSITCVVAFASLAFAVNDLIRPFITLKEEFNDNIFLERNDTDSDWITTVSPGFEFKPRFNKHRFTLYYRADLNYFMSNTDENSEGHTANTDLELNFN